MKSRQSLVWTKYREGNEVIDLHGLFSGYWSSKNHEFTVMSQLSTPTSCVYLLIESQSLLSLESTVALWKYNSQPMIPFVPLPLPISTG